MASGGYKLTTFWVALLFLWGLGTWWLATQVFTVPRQVWDFYPAWKAVRALLFQGVNPYSRQVAFDNQLASYGRPARPGEDPRAFSYPLLLVLPLAWLSLGWAQALWLSTTMLVFFTVVGGWLRMTTRKAVAWTVLLWLPFLYPLAWALLLGPVLPLGRRLPHPDPLGPP